MAGWKFEKVYRKNIGSGTISDMCFDGKYVYVTNGTKIVALEFWGEHDLDCRHELDWDELEDPKFDDKLRTKKEVTITTNSLVFAEGFLWATNAATFTTIYKIDPTLFMLHGDVVGGQTINCVVSTITVPTITVDGVDISNCYSQLAYGYGKLWMVYSKPTTQDHGDDNQRYTWYNIGAGTFGTPVRIVSSQKQVEKIYITDGLNGYMYFGIINQLAVLKVNGTTGAISAQIRIGNRFITRLFTNEEREIFVNSTNGLVTQINGTNNSITHMYNTIGEICGQFFVDETYLWGVTSTYALLRVTKADKKTFFSDPGPTPFDNLQDDYKLDLTAFTGSTQFTKILKTNPFYYEYINDQNALQTVVVNPYIFLAAGNDVYCFKYSNPLYRTGSATLKGVAMISSGESDFTG